jgi:hypothetical protein
MWEEICYEIEHKPCGFCLKGLVINIIPANLK